MQFLVYGTEQNLDASTPPSPEMMAQIANLVADSQKAGVPIATGALAQTGTRLRRAGGKFTVTDGPLIMAKELLGGWAILQVKSLEEAIEWSKRFRNIVGDGESEIVRIYGPEDSWAG